MQLSAMWFAAASTGILSTRLSTVLQLMERYSFMSQLEFPWGELERKSVPELWTVDEIFEEVAEDTLGRFIEDQRLERKTAGTHAESLATDVCMWANTPPDGGIIAVGVEDKGEVTGCRSKTQFVLDVERRIRSDLVPDAVFTTKRLQVANSNNEPDYVLLYRIQYRDDKLVETNKGEAYIRRVNSCHLLTELEKRELRMERGQLSYELEPCGLQWPDAFDHAAMRAWARGVQRRKELTDEPPLPQVLVSHRLGKMVKGDFVPNNACALLFAHDPQAIVPGCMIRFQRIEGREAATGKNRNVVKDIPIVGTVPHLIEKAADVLATHLRMYSRLGKGGRFFTAPEYPEEAWHEAIVNACVHRSYSLKGANIFIRMFDDRLVIESPGGFPPLVNPDNIYDVHHRRNWWLMDAMFYLDYVQCENEGVKRIRKAMIDMDLPAPEFEHKQIGAVAVRITLRNNQEARKTWVDADISHLVGADAAKKLSDLERRAINFAAEHDHKIKASEAMNLIPRPRWGTADKLLRGLVEKKYLKFVSRYARDPTAYFLLLDDMTRDRDSE
jgi:ATP-dependent DNA helicase RecG